MNVDVFKSLSGAGYNLLINLSDIDCGYKVGDRVDTAQQVPKTLSQNLRYPFSDEVKQRYNFSLFYFFAKYATKPCSYLVTI